MTFHIYSGTGFGALLTLYKVGVQEGVIRLSEFDRVRWVFTLLVHVVSNRRMERYIFLGFDRVADLGRSRYIYISKSKFVPSLSIIRGA